VAAQADQRQHGSPSEADRAKLTNQSAGCLVDCLEEHGYVEPHR
jgi:hypothetical protein